MRIFYTSLIKRLKPLWFEAIVNGAKKHGYTEHLEYTPHRNIIPGDILITWNRHGIQNDAAIRFEKLGNRVIVHENPYIHLDTHISVGIGYHNKMKCSLPLMDSGERFKSFGVEIKPWKHNPEGHVVFCTQSKVYDQRGLGWHHYAQPVGADTSILHKIRRLTDREIVFRMNPKSNDYTPLRRILGKNITVSNCKKNNTTKDILKDLKNAWCTAVWTSNSATDSLLEGIPVVLMGPGVFLKNACNHVNFIENLKYPDREPLFYRMAWNQFSYEEVNSGYLFDLILHNSGNTS